MVPLALEIIVSFKMVLISPIRCGGQHCYLGAGAKILIGVHLGNHTIVGANAVVTKSFDEENVVLAGVPARIISHKGFKDRKTV